MARSGELRQLFARPRFPNLYATRLTSQAADGVFQACLVGYVLFSPQRATSAAVIAGSLAVVQLPFSVIGPFTGIVLDRASRRRTLVTSSVLRAGLLGLLAGLIAAGHTGADFYLAALATAGVSRFVNSALSASLPVVVPTDDGDQGDRPLIAANALTTTSGTIATLAGAGVGGATRGIVGGTDHDLAYVAVLSGLAYLAAAAVATHGRRADFGPLDPPPWRGTLTQTRQVAADLAAGFRHLWARPPARDALGAYTAFRVCYGLVFVATILLYRNTFHGWNSGLGGLAAATAGTGAGTVLAAVVTPRVTRRISKPAWITVTIGGAGVAVTALGLPFSSTCFLVAAPILGFAAQGAKICVDTYVQEETDDAFRGRAFSLYDLLFNLAFVAAAGIAALTLPPSGRSPVMIAVIGAGFVLTALVYWRGERHRSARPVPPVPADVAPATGAPAEVARAEV